MHGQFCCGYSSFSQHTTLAIMSILASEVLLCENKNSSGKILYPVRIEPGAFDSKSNTLLSEINWYLLLRGSLNFCSCTTWFLDLDDLIRINRAWLFKEPKVSVSQTNAKLAQKGECWTWNQRSQVQSFLEVIFCYENFLFSRSKASDANIGSIAISSCLRKTLLWKDFPINAGNDEEDNFAFGFNYTWLWRRYPQVKFSRNCLAEKNYI